MSFKNTYLNYGGYAETNKNLTGLVTLSKLINNPTLKNFTISGMSMYNKIIDFCKLIYIGFAVLEIIQERLPVKE